MPAEQWLLAHSFLVAFAVVVVVAIVQFGWGLACLGLGTYPYCRLACHQELVDRPERTVHESFVKDVLFALLLAIVQFVLVYIGVGIGFRYERLWFVHQ